MSNFNKKDIKINSRDWKEKNQEYIQALEDFLDIVDNIEDENLKLEVIYKMLKCDEILTKIAEQKR